MQGGTERPPDLVFPHLSRQDMRGVALHTKRIGLVGLGVVVACLSAIACTGGSPSGPSTPGGGATASCRTAASSTRSVQTFVTGQVVSTDFTCTFNGTTDVSCQGSFTDSTVGAGTITQTSRFASKSDIVDEVATNPPLARSLSTTTVLSLLGVVFTSTTATNSYDAQRRLASTVVSTQTPIGPITATTTFSAWDSSGRPTSGTQTGDGAAGQISYSYDNANRSVTRIIGLNTCTQTYDPNGIVIKEVCTGTTPSTTNVTINSTQSICK